MTCVLELLDQYQNQHEVIKNSTIFTTTSENVKNDFKHEYLRSRAYICLLLSSPSSYSSGDISSN